MVLFLDRRPCETLVRNLSNFKRGRTVRTSWLIYNLLSALCDLRRHTKAVAMLKDDINLEQSDMNKSGTRLDVPYSTHSISSGSFPANFGDCKPALA